MLKPALCCAAQIWSTRLATLIRCDNDISTFLYHILCTCIVDGLPYQFQLCQVRHLLPAFLVVGSQWCGSHTSKGIEHQRPQNAEACAGIKYSLLPMHRWWEARSTWGQVFNVSRNLARQVGMPAGVNCKLYWEGSEGI